MGGPDYYNVYILFGMKIPADSKLYKTIYKFQLNNFKLFASDYYLFKNGEDFFIVLKLVRFGVGSDDVYLGNTEIISPTDEEVSKFKAFFNDYDFNYDYGQYFIY
jgi:hypothetical protein